MSGKKVGVLGIYSTRLAVENAADSGIENTEAISEAGALPRRISGPGPTMKTSVSLCAGLIE